MIPETRYALAGDVHLAYQVLGTGPVDVVLADQWFSHMDAQWDVPPLAELRQRLASFSTLILFDKRGIGLSDPVPAGGRAASTRRGGGRRRRCGPGWA